MFFEETVIEIVFNLKIEKESNCHKRERNDVRRFSYSYEDRHVYD